MNNEVFISYVQPDRNIAFRIHDVLHANNIKSWIAPSTNYGIGTGEYYGGEIVKAIKHCHLFILIYSSYVNNSIHIKREIYNADAFGKKIIPVKLDNSDFNDDLSLLLTGVEYVDATGNRLEAAINRLLNEIIKCKQPGARISSDKFQYNRGITLLANKEYYEAEKVLSETVSIDPGNFDAKFYLALSMMKGKKPQKLDGLLVKAVEKLLMPAIKQHKGAKILLAIIKYGYYSLNGFNQTPPDSQQLLDDSLKIDNKLAESILLHLEDVKNPVWQLFYYHNN